MSPEEDVCEECEQLLGPFDTDDCPKGGKHRRHYSEGQR